eukprot:GFKZ01000611.1.p1 GENE.GFKZ01000611.1~~GFKZ01000611.1.p1  ORF type:complete len:807 (+),score=84.11 GFKZ01000611.1:503-2923(+)
MAEVDGNSKHVLVIGGGVVGITCAIQLRQSSFDVTVVAENYPDTISNASTAVWQCPPPTPHPDPHPHATTRSSHSSKHWSTLTYEKLKRLHSSHGPDQSGIRLQHMYSYFPHSIDHSPSDLHHMNHLNDTVDDFDRGLHIIPDQVDPTFLKDNINDCYKHIAPIVDTAKYMPWLRQQAIQLGCSLLQQRIDNNLILDETLLLKRYSADAIIACPGLGAISILGDSQMYPLRSTFLRLHHPQPILTSAHCLKHKHPSISPQHHTLMLPHAPDTVLLAGPPQPNHWHRGVSPDDPIVSQLQHHCLQLVPSLAHMVPHPTEPVRTATYPCASRGPLLERVPATNIILNYGHGGAAFSLSWGCAERVVQLVRKVVSARTSVASEIGGKLDSSRPTTFILQDMLSFRTQMGRLTFMKHNLVLMCSRRGLSKIPGHEFVHFDLVRVVDKYGLDALASSVGEVMAASGLSVDQCRIVTNDEYSILLCGQVRESLGIRGPGADRMLPFFDKDATKRAISGSGRVRLPRYVVFDSKAFEAEPDGYVDEVMRTVGSSRMFIKPVVGAGSEKTWRLDGREDLMRWCEDNGSGEGVFEIDERITGELFNTSVIRVNGKDEHFFAMRHNRPNDEYLRGGKLGNIIVAESDRLYSKLKQFSEHVLDELREYCEDNCVYNIDLFMEDESEDMVLMEVAARAAGGGVGKVIEQCCGIALDETSLLLQMGHGSVLKMRESAEMTCYAAYSLHPPKKGVVKRLEMPEVSCTVAGVSWRVKPGQRLREPRSMRDIAVMVVISDGDMGRLAMEFEQINSEEYVIME